MRNQSRRSPCRARDMRFPWPLHVPNRLLLARAVPVALVITGTVGFMLIEGWSLFDSLYMTVITLTTVGYLEVHEMSPAGRAFTMALCLGGVFTLFYMATELIRAVV